MNGVLVGSIILSETVSQVLVKELRNERSDGSHKLRRNHDNIEEDAERGLLILNSGIVTLHARTI